MLDTKKQQIEKRNLLSSFFVTLLIGIAYQEMIIVVRDSIQVAGITLEILLLMVTFVFISMRFFVGNQLHLLSDSFVKLPGLTWLYDLMAIIAQSVVLILLGSFVSVETNLTSTINFVDFMIVLYIIDVTWIISQWVLGKFFSTWEREFIPWAWAILNSLLVGSIFLLNFFVKDLYTTNGLIWLLGLNLVGFVIDVVLVDYYDAIQYCPDRIGRGEAT